MQKDIKQIPIPRLKRIFDIFFSLFLIVILSPVFIFILALIFLEHLIRGKFLSPLIYVEKRISQGQEFNFPKFNIFKPSVIEQLKKEDIFINTKTLEHDGRSLTFTGRVLQKIYFDELPQIFCVLTGKISFVGSRPVNIEAYKKALSQKNYNKYVLKAGLTGNYQSRKGVTKKTEAELDGEYIDFCRKNPSWKILLKDIKIILRTLKVVFRAEGI